MGAGCFKLLSLSSAFLSTCKSFVWLTCVATVAADTLDKDSSRIMLECDESGRYCHYPGSNATVRTGPEHTFG